MESSDRGEPSSAMTEPHNSASWPKRGRPQSMIAQEWSDKLDNLFKIDSGLDTRLQSVEEKRKSVFAQNRQLEELQARIKAAEERLKQAGSESNTPTTSTSHSPERPTDAAKAIFSTMETTRIPEQVPEEEEEEEEEEQEREHSAVEEARTPISTTSNEYVVVERPRFRRRRNVQADDSDSNDDEESE